MSGNPDGKARGFGWSPPQRRALTALLAVLLVYLSIRFALDRSQVPDPQPPEGSRAAELASRIDPNTADWQTLSAIPTLGPKRAKDIVAFRERAHASDPSEPVFRSSVDLMHVRGIGPATIENLRPYLIFPSDSQTARP
jgi:DNA uptake protein ComE-like DNA-binding protein